MANRKANLNLEGLTDRVVPAVAAISFYNGNLSIRLNNQGGTLTLLGQSNNYRVEFEGVAIGNLSGYNVTGNMNITGGNGADTVEFTPRTAGKAYQVPGNLAVNLGNGNDALSTTGLFSVNGSANINVGNGNDTIDISSGAATDTTTVNGNLTVNMLAGDDTLTADTGAFTVNGFTTINGGNTVTLTATGATTAVDGTSILLNSLTVNSNAGETFANTLELGSETQLRGNLVFISGSFSDTVTIDGSTILGNATLNLGQGTTTTAQTVTLSENAPTTINGSLTVLSGNTVDNVQFDAANATTISGNVTLNLGNGNNIIGLDGDGKSLIGGALTILTGTGDDAVTIGSAGKLFSINGSASITLGNSLTNGNSLTFVSTQIGGNLSYVGGTGIDTVTFTSVAQPNNNIVAGRVSANMGGGEDTFEIDSGAAGAGTTAFGSLYLDFGVGSGPDTFTNDSGVDFDIFVYNFVNVAVPA